MGPSPGLLLLPPASARTAPYRKPHLLVRRSCPAPAPRLDGTHWLRWLPASARWLADFAPVPPPAPDSLLRFPSHPPAHPAAQTAPWVHPHPPASPGKTSRAPAGSLPAWLGPPDSGMDTAHATAPALPAGEP